MFQSKLLITHCKVYASFVALLTVNAFSPEKNYLLIIKNEVFIVKIEQKFSGG